MVEVLIPDSAKIELLKRIGVGNLHFVKKAPELNEYQCVSCTHLALYNYTAVCQHVYRNKCHPKFNGKSCSVKGCLTTIGVDTKYKLKDKEIANLEVFCIYNNVGCLEKIALRNYLDHINNCKFRIRNLLPKLYKESEFLVYKEKTNEEINKLREENNALQAKIMQIENQLSDHQNDKSIMEKVNKVSESIKKDLSSITVRFSSDTELQKKEMQSLRKHVDDKLTDIIERQAVKQNVQEQMMKKVESDIIQKISNIQENLVKSEETLTQRVDKMITTQMKEQKVQQYTTTQFEWNISGIRQIAQDWKDGIMKEIVSNTFTIKDYGYTMQCKLMYNAKLKSFNMLFRFGSDIPQSAPAIYNHQRSLEILDQSRFGEKHIVRIDTPGFGNSQSREWMSGYHNDSWMIPVEVLSTKSPYVLKDCIIAKILIEPLAIVYKSIFSRNGTLIWKLDNYSQRKQDYIDSVTKCLRSPYFYTHEQGYRVHLGLHVRSHDISFYLSFNKGEFDDYLPSTFPHQATLVIMTQQDQFEHKSLIHTQTSSDATSNLVAMIPTKDIESPAYLQGDSILIKLVVE